LLVNNFSIRIQVAFVGAIQSYLAKVYLFQSFLE